jgi:hypothetical protein
MILLTHLSRADLLPLLPRNAVVSEIGVALGNFASQIVEYSSPKVLHLIDPWEGLEGEYVKAYRGTKAKNNEIANRFELVQRRFADNPNVRLHRDFSQNALPRFPDNTFDWTYVDAMHDYDSVLNDLRLVDPKVRDDGLILGHDFSDTNRANFGVVPAVKDFVAERGYALMAINMEKSPSYVICKDRNSESAVRLRNGILDRRAVEISFDLFFEQFTQVRHITPDNRPVLIVRLGDEGERPALPKKGFRSAETKVGPIGL